MLAVYHLFLLVCCVHILQAKPGARSDPAPAPAPWDWQQGEQVDYAKYNMYEEEMKKMLDQPYFARVNNKTRVKVGEVGFLPCRVKEMKAGYMVTWMRLSDVTILSVGSQPFTSDNRYQVIHIHR